MRIAALFKYRGRGLANLKSALRVRGLVPEFSDAFNQVNRLYRAFLRERFVKFSRGGGNWKKLAASTLKARRNKNKGSVAILRDTDAMFASFQPSIVKTFGIVKKKAKLGFNVTFGSPIPHHSGVSTITLMKWHHSGAGRLPARKLVVDMDIRTARRAARIFERAMARVMARRG